MSPETEGATNWITPTAWSLLAASAILLLASFTGSGGGMFGWGFMAGMMWIWMVLPLLVVVGVIVWLAQRTQP